MKFRFMLLGVSLAFILGSCATTYRGPSTYVDYPYDGKAKSANSQSLVGTNPKLKSTYDDEFVYDAAGNLIKHKQTEYFNLDKSKPDYVVWQTEFKLVGGVLLPYRQSANDVVYLEIEYEPLVSQNKGAIRQGTFDRRFYTQEQVGFQRVFGNWSPELKIYPVDFPVDGKFVVSQATVDYTGYNTQNILSLGYDNIVLKRYFYSHTKLQEGVSKSFQGGLFGLNNNFKTVNTEFVYEWKAVANTIVQTKLTFTRSFGPSVMVFVAAAEYNDAGQRTKEDWTAQQDKEKPVTVFHQELKY